MDIGKCRNNIVMRERHRTGTNGRLVPKIWSVLSENKQSSENHPVSKLGYWRSRTHLKMFHPIQRARASCRKDELMCVPVRFLGGKTGKLCKLL